MESFEVNSLFGPNVDLLDERELFYQYWAHFEILMKWCIMNSRKANLNNLNKPNSNYNLLK